MWGDLARRVSVRSCVQRRSFVRSPFPPIWYNQDTEVCNRERGEDRHGKGPGRE